MLGAVVTAIEKLCCFHEDVIVYEGKCMKLRCLKCDRETEGISIATDEANPTGGTEIIPDDTGRPLSLMGRDRTPLGQTHRGA